MNHLNHSIFLPKGCSVEAMMKLDAAIAKDEKAIKARTVGSWITALGRTWQQVMALL